MATSSVVLQRLPAYSNFKDYFDSKNLYRHYFSNELGHHSCGLAMQSCPHVPSQDQVNPRWLRKLLKKKMQLTPNT